MPAPTSAPWALVLAGGDGTRLRDLTTLIAGAPIPKQYCRIDGAQSLLEATLARIGPLVPPARTLAVVNRRHLDLARDQLRTLPAANVLVQPDNRETGPGLLFSLLQLARRDPDATVAVFPSDHYVTAPGVFVAHVRRMLGIVEATPGAITLLGIRPERPDPGYGYVEPAAALDAPGGGSAFRVARFHEKPDPPTAARIVARGGLWNAFVMAFRVRDVLELVAERRPADFVALACPDDPTVLARRYETLRPWNFSRDLLTRAAERLVVVRADGTGWTDWGTREAIERTFAELSRVPPWQAGGRAPAPTDAVRFALFV